MGHACEFETSLMLRLHPDLVHPERAVVRYPDDRTPYLSTDLVQGSIAPHLRRPSTISPRAAPSAIPGLASTAEGCAVPRHERRGARILRDFSTWPIPEKRS